jgi:hypothetical protein
VGPATLLPVTAVDDIPGKPSPRPQRSRPDQPPGGVEDPDGPQGGLRSQDSGAVVGEPGTALRDQLGEVGMDVVPPQARWPLAGGVRRLIVPDENAAESALVEARAFSAFPAARARRTSVRVAGGPVEVLQG